MGVNHVGQGEVCRVRNANGITGGVEQVADQKRDPDCDQGELDDDDHVGQGSICSRQTLHSTLVLVGQGVHIR